MLTRRLSCTESVAFLPGLRVRLPQRFDGLTAITATSHRLWMFEPMLNGADVMMDYVQQTLTNAATTSTVILPSTESDTAPPHRWSLGLATCGSSTNEAAV